MTGFSLAVVFFLGFLVHYVRRKRPAQTFDPRVHNVDEFRDEELGGGSYREDDYPSGSR